MTIASAAVAIVASGERRRPESVTEMQRRQEWLVPGRFYVTLHLHKTAGEGRVIAFPRSAV